MYDLFLKRLKEADLGIHAIEVFHNGETVLHHTTGEDIRFPVYSVTKSVTSAAFSLACGDGLLSAEMPLADFLDTRYRPMMTEDFKKMPFARFLTMTAGKYPFRPDGDDWLSMILSLDTDYSDTGFHYSNIPAYLVGAAVENAVGGDLKSFLEKRLFEPLGIPAISCRTSPEGHFYGATGMELTVHEFALLGRLYLQKGEWQGAQIINEKAVIEAITPHVETGAGDCYGYFFRVAEDHFTFSGKWGQRCLVYPDEGLVIACLSHQPERSDELCRLLESCAEEICRQFSQQ